MLRVVISDASPLHYLVLIGHVELLPGLYSEVLIPEAVADETPADCYSGARPAMDRRSSSVASSRAFDRSAILRAARSA